MAAPVQAGHPLAEDGGRDRELNGMEEFSSLHWLSFDPQTGKLVCRTLGLEFDDLIGAIRESKVVRLMKDEDGLVFCGSGDRRVADVGRPGRECATCEDKDVHCFPRWQITIEELGSGMVFAHTLSMTGSTNFNAYANRLVSEGLKPSEVLTRVYVETAHRKKTHTAYKRLQFERVDDESVR